jgi:periplasmic protein CpxP/Spy
MMGTPMDIFTRKHLAGWMIGLLVVINLVTLATLWLGVLWRPAASPPPRGDNRPDDVNRFLERELNLTVEQAAKLEDLRRRNAAAMQSIQEEIHRLKKAEVDELLAPRTDAARIDELAAEIGTKEAEKEKVLFSHLQDLMALCRPDQQEKLRSVMGELVRLMGPPGQPTPGGKPPAKKRPEGPADRQPGEKVSDRPGDEPPGKRPPRRPGEPPPPRPR